jgi:hypothetical protein
MVTMDHVPSVIHSFNCDPVTVVHVHGIRFATYCAFEGYATRTELL